jgi:hypothetical protein
VADRFDDDRASDEDDVVVDAPPQRDLLSQLAPFAPLLMMIFGGQNGGQMPHLIEMLDWNKAHEAGKKARASSSAPTPVSVIPETAAPDPLATMAKAMAVLGQLAPDEQKLAQVMAMELPNAQRVAWLAELAPLSIDDAVAKVRVELNRPATSAGGVS